jgi:hypothetical protein
MKSHESGWGASRYRGVARKAGFPKRWRAQIQLNLGDYDNELDAADIYVRAERLFREQAIELRRMHGDLHN